MVKTSYRPNQPLNCTFSLNIPVKEDSPNIISELSPSRSTSPEPENLLTTLVPTLESSIDPAAEGFLNYIKQTQNFDPKSGSIVHKPIPIFNQKWVRDMALEAEPENLSILYAKSVLAPAMKNNETLEGCRIHIGYSPLQTSSSSAFGAIPPTKPPRKCIARMTSSLNDIIMAQQTSENSRQTNKNTTFNQTNQVPNLMATSIVPETAVNNSPIWRRPSSIKSTYRISDQCRWIPSNNRPVSSPTTSTNTIQSIRTMIQEDDLPPVDGLKLESSNPTPIPHRRRRAERSTTISGIDFSWNAMRHNPNAMAMSLTEYPSQSCSIGDYSELPYCESESTTTTSSYRFINNNRENLRRRPTSLRHSIFINDDSSTNMDSSKQNLYEINEEPPQIEQKYSSSPNSVRSASSSIDSGQCSGDPEINYSLGCSSNRGNKSRSGFSNYMESSLPSYARMASTMDHILRISSSIYSLLNSNLQNPVVSRELFHKTNIYIQLIRQSSCGSHLPEQDIDLVLNTMRNAERDAKFSGKPIFLTDYFSIVTRKMLEQTLLVFGKVITNYLTECVNKDRLLVIALEHFVHLLLFGDELCLQAIQNKAIDNIISFCRMLNTPKDTLKLLLRALAVLCSVTKGCLQLLSIGGLEVVIHLLCNSTAECSVEAAGVLTQLTHPGRSFIKMHSNLSPIILRLLELVDESSSSESLLLCMAAIANLTLQSANIVDLLYQHNAILKIVRATSKPNCNNIFVQEQVVTTFSRLANKSYDQALIMQGAIPVLTRMLTVTDPKHTDYCKRIRYKAAVCVGTISSSSLGLKAIYENQCYAQLCEVLKMENHVPNPMTMICSSIKQRIENTYEVETSV